MSVPLTSSARRPTLEEWDAETGKWQLYRHQEHHSADCKRYPFDDVPSWIFLDTSVINLMVKFDGSIFEGEPIPEDVNIERAYDIEALMHLMNVGTRANWVVTTSPRAIDELSSTRNESLRGALLNFGREFLFTHEESYAHSLDLGRRSADASFLQPLPDRADRELLGNAVGLGCDTFCTADRSTIVRHRHTLVGVPIRILTPLEWWQHFKPWAGLVM